MRSRFQLWVGAAVLVCLAAGCYWLRYDALVRTHVDLMLSMATKLVEVTERGGAPSRMAEYRYPLERARDFVRIVEGRFADRISLGELRGFCDAYEGALDAAVQVGSGGGGMVHLRDALVPVRARAVAVVAALEREADD